MIINNLMLYQKHNIHLMFDYQYFYVNKYRINFM
jgi:hypothetical protein